ncbi:MAG: hypothetical protein ACLFPA_06090 [Dichotomicrobium sp.]
MIAELIVASVFAAAGGPGATSSAPSPENAVIRFADSGRTTIQRPMLQHAADLGCPRRYDRRRGYDRRCYDRRGDPYHKTPEHRYGRYDHDSYDDGHYDTRRRYDRDYDRHDRRGRDYREGYRHDPDRLRDTLRDRYGRPYPEPEDDRPPYRSGAYDESRPGGRDYDRRGYRGEPGRGFSRDDRRLDPFRESDGPIYRPERDGYDIQPIDYLHRSNYREPAYKKKDMTVTGVTSGIGATITAATTITADTGVTTGMSDAKTEPRPAAFDAGSTV